MTDELRLIKEMFDKSEKNLADRIDGVGRKVTGLQDSFDKHEADLTAHGAAAVEKAEKKEEDETGNKAIRQATVVAWLGFAMGLIVTVVLPVCSFIIAHYPRRP